MPPENEPTNISGRFCQIPHGQESVMDLVEGLAQEIKRCEELLQEYINIGMTGIFATAMLKEELKQAKLAQASGDVVAMIKCYKSLEESH